MYMMHANASNNTTSYTQDDVVRTWYEESTPYEINFFS
jgi:hypothetical protein